MVTVVFLTKDGRSLTYSTEIPIVATQPYTDPTATPAGTGATTGAGGGATSASGSNNGGGKTQP